MRLKGTGTLRYDPYRGDMKSNTDWWLIVDTDPEIVRYYAQQVMANPAAFGETKIVLLKPSWGSHISVVRGEEPRGNFKKLWKKYGSEKIKFEYSHVVRRSGDTTPSFHLDHFWFVDVWCDRLNEIRSELGLKAHYDDGRPFHHHLTVGRIR